MNHFKLTNRVGWGNEIHIETKKATYAGSGRGYSSGEGIKHRKPTLDEFLEQGYPTKVKVTGHCSTPYVCNGDIIEYEFSDFLWNPQISDHDPARSFKLKIVSLRRAQNVHDMFFAEAILIEAFGKPVQQKPKMSFFDWLCYCLSYPFWLLTPKEKRKPLDQFKSSCISHTCNFTGEIFVEQG